MSDMKSYRLSRVQKVSPLMPVDRFEVRFRFALVALRMEINTKRANGSFLMMTSRSKAPAPMAWLRKQGFKAKTKVIMLRKCEEWAKEHGIVLARS